MTILKGRMKFYLWRQWAAAFEIFMLTITMGSKYGWISPTMANLSRPNPPFEATEQQKTWIASLTSICVPIGAVSGSIITYTFGTKVSTYICGIHFLIEWLCLCCAKSVELVFLALIFSGIGLGSIATSYPLFIGEIANPKIRGGLVTFIIHGINIGLVIGNYMGAYVDLWIFATFNLILIIIFLITFAFFPHTPYFFIQRNKLNDANESTKWYNNDIAPSDSIEPLSTPFSTNEPMNLPFLKSMKLLITPVNRKILMKIVILQILLQLTGIYVLGHYMEIMFIKSNITVVQPSMLVLIMNCMAIIASWIGIYVNNRFERKSIFLVSCMMLTVAYVAWGFTYYLIELKYDTSNLQWIVIMSSALFQIDSGMGLHPIINMLKSEIFPPIVKSVSVSICIIVASLFSFIIQKNFQLMINSMTHKYVFYLFAAVSFIAGIYMKIFIPETKGKTIKEIQAMLNKTKQCDVLPDLDIEMDVLSNG